MEIQFEPFLYITLSNGYLQCSCKVYERYGYPCHHTLHVVNCYCTHDIKREWIHIRWSKDYLFNYFNSSTDPKYTIMRFMRRYMTANQKALNITVNQHQVFLSTKDFTMIQ